MTTKTKDEGIINQETLGGLSLALQGLGAVFGASGAYSKSKSDRYAYEYQAAVERNRAQIADWQAADAFSRGEDAVNKSNMQYVALEGAQRARFAAGNKALDEGSPYAILRDTDYVKRVDAATISDNAAKEAWALRMSAQTARSNAAFLQQRASSESPGRSAAASLLSSAGAVASTWYRLRGGLPI